MHLPDNGRRRCRSSRKTSGWRGLTTARTRDGGPCTTVAAALRAVPPLSSGSPIYARSPAPFSSAASGPLRLAGAGLARPGRRVAGREAVVDRGVNRFLVPGPIGPVVVRVDALAVGPGPGGALAVRVAGRVLQPLLVEVDHVAADLGVVGQEAPRQGVVALAEAEEAAEGHDRVGHLAGDLVDHEVVHRAEPLALVVVDRRALDLVGGDQLVGLVGRDIDRAARARADAGFGADVLHRNLPVGGDREETRAAEGQFRGLPAGVPWPRHRQDLARSHLGATARGDAGWGAAPPPPAAKAAVP